MRSSRARTRGLVAALGAGTVVTALLVGASGPGAPTAAAPVDSGASVAQLLADASAPAGTARGAALVAARPESVGRIAASVPANGAVPLPKLKPEHVPDPEGLARAKAAAAQWAAARTGRAEPTTQRVGTAPTAVRSWDGISDPESQPSDSTGAVGPTRYVEMVNSQVAIYSRTSNTPLVRGSLMELMGCVDTFCADNQFDPQVMWDEQTNRFYYTADDIVSSTANYLTFGFSKTASPGSNLAADWCRYNIGYGAEFPDYPKLGDSANFAIIGVNTFAGNTFRGSDLIGISKPAAGTTCPDPSTFGFGIGKNLKMAGGTAASFTPVPAMQTDADATGYAVARSGSFPSTGGTALALYRITRGTTGNPVFQLTGRNVPVPAYRVPADVPQPGSTDKLDSSDTRPTQAVSAVDPLRANKIGLWTQHTVLAGAGAAVRWYQIDPVAATVMQSGTISSPTNYVFNGAVSPDRLVRGTTRQFGGNMLATFNQGNASNRVGVYVASKKGTADLSAPVLLKLSTTIDRGFGSGCAGQCRWGDYAAATPDPGASATAATGAVWITTMYNGPANAFGANWGTWNAGYRP